MLVSRGQITLKQASKPSISVLGQGYPPTPLHTPVYISPLALRLLCNRVYLHYAPMRQLAMREHLLRCGQVGLEDFYKILDIHCHLLTLLCS
jgi:hypothetical protein